MNEEKDFDELAEKLDFDLAADNSESESETASSTESNSSMF